MADEVQTIYDIGKDITPEMDGALYSLAVPDCVCSGVGDSFKANTSSSNNNIVFSAGSEAIIGGSFFKMMNPYTINMQPYAGSTVNIYAKIDKTAAVGSKGTFSVKATSVDPEVENLNATGQIREMLLYTVTVDGSGHPTTVTDKRVLKTNTSEDVIKFVYCSTKAKYDAINPKDSNTYYFIKEYA